MAFSPTGYTDSPANFEDYLSQVQVAIDAKNGASWALGDLYNIGNERYEDSYAQAFSEAHVAFVTVKNYARVARVFDKKTRNRYNLSFRHFDAVSSGKLSDAERHRLLQDAVDKQMSSGDLRKHAQEYQGRKVTEPIKATCKVEDIITLLTRDFGLSEHDMIDITVKQLEAIAA